MEHPTLNASKARGFTLIEVLVVVAIIGILSAIALPSYRDYVLRARLTDAFSGLGAVQTAAEEYWANKHTYSGMDEADEHRIPAATANFSFALTSSSASAYLVTATGRGPMTGFSYTIDQNGNRATTAAPAGWGTSTTCWIDRKGGACVQ